MTDEEREYEIGLKRETSAKLQTSKAALMSKHAAVFATDDRIRVYVEDVIDHPEKHNLYEVLGVSVFFDRLARYEWASDKVKRFFKLYETLRFSGVVRRTSYKLTPVQCFIFGNIYGLQRDGKRLIRTAYIFVPRKFSKTTSAAAMAVNDMLFGDNNAQSYVGANSYEQAKICFDEIRRIMLDIDPSGKHFKVNREKILFKDKGRDSLIRCLTANAKTQDGLFASLVILDEYAQARNTASANGADLKNVLTTSMGPRLEPLTVIITTASDVLDGPCFNEIEGVKRVLRGELQSDTVFGLLCMPDVDDEDNDPATWAKVQPHLGVTVQPDYYDQEWNNAQISSANMLAFRTKLLNRFVVDETREWVSTKIVRASIRDFQLTDIPRKGRIVVSIDLSESDDFSAVTWAWADSKTKDEYFYTRYFFPEGALPTHPNRRLYTKWAEDGYLTLTPGDVIDYDMIVDYILGLADHASVVNVGYDPYKSRSVINKIGNSRFGAWKVINPVQQNKASFTAPVEVFEHGIKTGHIFINANPINVYCFGNVKMIYDDNGNCKPWHMSETQKIDGVITMLMCMKQIIDYKW